MTKQPKRQPKAQTKAETVDLLALAAERLARATPEQLRRAKRSLWRSEHPGVYRWNRD
jgi:hypothetical protein